MQLTQQMIQGLDDETFSILGRIGGDATIIHLQSLQVVVPAFSILGRIGGDATRQESARIHGLPALSVSSVGSEVMQLSVCVERQSVLS